jgi:molecular chaperone GrpE
MTKKKTTAKTKPSKADEYLEGWQRAKAELDNFKKTAAAERVAMRERIIAETVLPLLSVADNFSAIAQHVPKDLASNAWAQGAVHVAQQLESLLGAYGVTKMDAANKPFDPTMHEAIDHVSGSKAEAGTNSEVLQAGYLIGDKVLRPAKVKVAK